MPIWTNTDIDEYVNTLGIKHLPTEEIVNELLFKAFKGWYQDRDNIKQLLWDEKIDDAEGDRLTRHLNERVGDWIFAIQLWARQEH